MRSVSMVLLAVALFVAGSAVAAQDEKPVTSDPWGAAQLSRPDLEKALAATRESLKAIPEDDARAGAKAGLRPVLKVRVDLLQELLGVLDKRAELRRRETRLGDAESLKATLKELQAKAEATAPTTPDTAGLGQLRTELEAARKRLAVADERLRSEGQRAEAIPAEKRQAASRRGDAETLARNLEKELESAKAEERDFPSQQYRNAQLEIRVATETETLLDAEAAFVKRAAPVRTLEREVDAAQRARVEAEFNVYETALRAALTAAQQRKEAEAKRAEEAKLLEQTPWGRFVAEMKAAVARSEAHSARFTNTTAELAGEVDGERKRGVEEKRDFEEIRDSLSRKGAHLDDELRQAIQVIQAVRTSLRAKPDLTLARLKRERWELYAAARRRERDLEQRWDERLAELKPLDEPSRDEAEGLRKALLGALARQQEVLRGFDVELKAVEDNRDVRRRQVDQAESFVRRRALWIRTASPLGPEVLEEAGSELGALRGWLGKHFSGQLWTRLTQRHSALVLVLIGLGVFLLLPLVLAAIVWRLRVYRRKVSDRPSSTTRKVWLTTAAVLGALLLPAYFYVLRGLVGTADVLAAKRVFTQDLLSGVILLALGLGLTRAFFGSAGLAPMIYGMPRDTARSIARFARVMIASAFVCLLPWAILRAAPFAYKAVPRLTFTAFEIMSVVAVIALLRRKSPFTRDTVLRRADWWVARRWTLLRNVFVAALAVIAVMDVLGYRFGAAHLFQSTWSSVIVIVGVFFAHRLFARLTDRILKRRRFKATAAPGETSAESAGTTRVQARRFFRFGFILLGIFLLTMVWGAHDRVLPALDELTLYTMTSAAGTPEPVSVGDWFTLVIVIVVTAWVLRNLGGVYEVLVFPRLKADTGIRYAILTISKYAVFLIGALIALSAIHLDLGRLQWVMAAVGFGLGFGLQEIFANLVSGLILLVERPVRVGDIVTIGSVEGEVKRINIRATTVLDWNRMEVMIPNRDLITKDVTNWTLADPITRIVIKIGVVYGSDVEEVRSLLLELARAQPAVLKDPEPRAFFLRHGDSSLDFELRAFVGATSSRLETTHRLNTLVNVELKKRGIGIPFPQRDLHIRSDARQQPTEADLLDGEPGA